MNHALAQRPPGRVFLSPSGAEVSPARFPFGNFFGPANGMRLEDPFAIPAAHPRWAESDWFDEWLRLARGGN